MRRSLAIVYQYGDFGAFPDGLRDLILENVKNRRIRRAGFCAKSAFSLCLLIFVRNRRFCGAGMCAKFAPFVRNMRVFLARAFLCGDLRLFKKREFRRKSANFCPNFRVPGFQLSSFRGDFSTDRLCFSRARVCFRTGIVTRD